MCNVFFLFISRTEKCDISLKNYETNTFYFEVHLQYLKSLFPDVQNLLLSLTSFVLSKHPNKKLLFNDKILFNRLGSRLACVSQYIGDLGLKRGVGRLKAVKVCIIRVRSIQIFIHLE